MLIFKGRIGNEGVAPYDTQYAIAGQLVTPHFLTHVEVNGQWDIYEYDLLGNRIYNLTGNLSRGIAYYDGIPSPVNPDLLIFSSYSGCAEGWSCLRLLTKSTGQVVNFGKFGIFWWSRDGLRIYSQDKYYDFMGGTWNTLSMDSCNYLISYSSFSPDKSKLVTEGWYYNPSTGYYDLYDILILTDWDLTHVIDMNTRNLVAVDNITCSDYGTDEDFMDAIPDFHPSDDKIIFTSDADGVYTIYLVDLAFGAMQRLTDASSGERGYFEATWSPDGEKILMAGGELSEIYFMPADGGTPTRITNEGIKHYFPRWIRYLGQ